MNRSLIDQVDRVPEIVESEATKSVSLEVSVELEDEFGGDNEFEDACHEYFKENYH